MRPPIFVTTLLLGILHAFPTNALSAQDVTELTSQETTVTADIDAIGVPSNGLLAGRPRYRSQESRQTQSGSSSSKRRSPSSATQAPAKRTTRRQPQRRSQPSATRAPAKTTTRRAQPKRRSPAAATQTPVKRTTRRARPQRRSQPKATQPARATRSVKARPASTVAKPKVRTGLRKRPQPQTPANSKLRKIRTVPSKAVAPKVVRPTAKTTLPKARQKAGRALVPTAVKVNPPRSTAKKKSRDRVKIQPAKVRTIPLRRSNVKVRTNSDYVRRRRVVRRQRYNPSRYWGSRRVQTRRLTRSYRPCYYCPGYGWSFSPTCYTRPSRYYIFADRLSYWPSIPTYRRSSPSTSSLNQQLIKQVEVAIRDYADLYDLKGLDDDIKVAQEGSIIILTGVVDREETLEDLIAIARDIEGVKYVVADDVTVRELEDGSGVLYEEETLTDLEPEPFQTVSDLGIEPSREDVIDLDVELFREEVIDLGIEPLESNLPSNESPIASTDRSPTIEINDFLQEELEDASAPTLEFVASTEDFLPSVPRLQSISAR